MKYSSFFLILILLHSKALFAQNNIIKDSDTLKYLIVQDIDTLHQVRINYYAPRKKNERDRLIYLNATLFDSSGINFDKDIHYFKDTFRGFQFDYIDKIYRVFSLNIGKRGLNKLLESRSFTPRTFHFGSNKSDQLLELAEDGNVSVFADLNPYLDYKEEYRSLEEIWKIHELSKEKILCESCAWGGGCTLYRYFIIRKDSVEEINFDQLRQPYKNQFEPQYEDFRVNFYFSHYDYDFLMAAVDYGNLPENTDLIFSKDLNDTTHILKKHEHWKVIGENIQEGHNEFFYLRSILDNKEKVIVNYLINKDFEKITYQLFKGHTVTKRELNNFNSDQLNILKNLIFAKYNYAFDNEFYQAYFNLFAFYNEPEKLISRTKEVNNNLTKTDVENLAIINALVRKK